MAHLELSYGKIIEVTPQRAKELQALATSPENGDKLVRITDTLSKKLRDIKGFDTSENFTGNDPSKPKYDIYEHRQFLTQFGNLVEMHRGEAGAERDVFRAYCLSRGLIVERDYLGHQMTSVNIEKTAEYADACEKWELCRRIRDEHVTREETVEGLGVLQEILALKKLTRITRVNQSMVNQPT